MFALIPLILSLLSPVASAGGLDYVLTKSSCEAENDDGSPVAHMGSYNSIFCRPGTERIHIEEDYSGNLALTWGGDEYALDYVKSVGSIRFFRSEEKGFSNGAFRGKLSFVVAIRTKSTSSSVSMYFKNDSYAPQTTIAVGYDAKLITR